MLPKFALNIIMHTPKFGQLLSYPKNIYEIKFTREYGLKITDICEHPQMHKWIATLPTRGSQHNRTTGKPLMDTGHKWGRHNNGGTGLLFQ